MKKSKTSIIIGIDEVGRGPLAGPVVVAALAMPKNCRIAIPTGRQAGLQNCKIPLHDSKKLSPKQREAWFCYLKKHPRISYVTARVYPRLIDKINITNAANLAATKAFRKLAASRLGLTNRLKVYLDGGLYLNKKNLAAGGYALNAKTIIKGDEKITAIKLASIVAKVTRDRYMVKLHGRYPQYGFKKHKGYGTKEHVTAIKKHGLSEIHRLTFVKKYFNLIKT